MSVPTWTTKDGRVMPIAKMDDRHLLNAHSMTVRNIRMIAFASIALASWLGHSGAPEDVCANLDGKAHDIDAALERLSMHERNMREEIGRRGLATFEDVQ